MTESELRTYSLEILMTDIKLSALLDLTMTSGFSTIAGSVLAAYISMGVPAQNLVTSSVMSIPASISISKMRFPEKDEPITRGSVVVDRGEDEKNRPVGSVTPLKILLGLI
jgi:concentrative nucleoside transporter, CNT family